MKISGERGFDHDAGRLERMAHSILAPANIIMVQVRGRVRRLVAGSYGFALIDVFGSLCRAPARFAAEWLEKNLPPEVESGRIADTLALRSALQKSGAEFCDLLGAVFQVERLIALIDLVRADTKAASIQARVWIGPTVEEATGRQGFLLVFRSHRMTVGMASMASGPRPGFLGPTARIEDGVWLHG